MLRVFPHDQRPNVPKLRDFLFDHGKPIPNYKPMPPIAYPRQEA
jgi:hypothetical protein